MKITIESTDRIVTVVQENGKGGTLQIPARVWEGKTESGIEVFCLVTLIAGYNHADLSQFEKELKETRPPSVQAMNVWPLRFIL